MNRKSIVMSVIVIAFTAMPAFSHTPLADWGQCPVPQEPEACFAPLPIFEITEVNSAVTSWPTEGAYDFCAYFDTFYCQLKALDETITNTEDFAYLMRCTDGDINGMPGSQFTANIPVSISVNSSGQCTIYWNGIQTHANVDIPGWNPQSDWYMGFGARCGFVREYHLVDNVDLAGNSFSYNETFSSGPGLGTLYEDAVIIYDGLRLTEALSDQQGAWSFLPTTPQTQFTLTFDQFMGGGEVGADGMSFVYGPGANSSFGEEGPVDQTGLRISFYTYGSLQNTIRIAYNGVIIADAQPGLPLFQAAQEINGNGMLDGQYELAILASVLNTPTHPLHADALAAFQHNFVLFKNAIQLQIWNEGYLDFVPPIAPYLIGSLSSMLAAYGALGDNATYEAMNKLLIAVDITSLPDNLQTITESVTETGPGGDMDLDGFTNFEEYTHYVNDQGYTPLQYTSYSMNTSLSIEGDRYYTPGSTIDLLGVMNYGMPDSYDWKKDGDSLGETTELLVIPNAQIADEGYYELTVSHSMNNKSSAEMYVGAIIYVGDYQVPVAGVIALTGLAAIIALVGAKTVGRRKHE